MTLEQKAHVTEIPKLLRGNRCDMEPALTFGNHQVFGGKPRQGFSECRDAHRVSITQVIEFQLLARR
ncbi:hypothetical protein D3C87_2036980 [compost metagenome]